jgi:predicted benzoate:H+ symporter BenE
MDTFTSLFWLSSLLFLGLSGYLLCCTKRTPVFYAQVGSGCAMFITSKIGRKFLGLD